MKQHELLKTWPSPGLDGQTLPLCEEGSWRKAEAARSVKSSEGC